MTSKFRNPDTRVKINPETYIKFDGSDHVMMQNIYGDQGIRIKYDIMLILYDMVDWKKIGDIIEPWPPDDQEKIMDHLEMLAEGRVIIDDESAPAEVAESGLSDNLGHNIHINVENHHAMLRDYVRMAAYRRAIERAVQDDTVAMDLGCGTGILSFFAAEAGARHVYAIEKRPDIIMLAQELANVNELGDRIEFIEGASSSIRAERLSPKPDLLIAEILGNGILEENVLEYTLDARDRFLSDTGLMIPYGLDIYLFAYDSGLRNSILHEVSEFKDLYGFDYSLLGQVLAQKTTTRTEHYNTRINKTMTEPLLAKSLDFRTMENTVFVEELHLEALEDGEVTGFCGYFKAHLDAETVLTNSPWAPPTHWTQITWTLPAPVKLEKGEQIPVELIYDGALRVRLMTP